MIKLKGLTWKHWKTKRFYTILWLATKAVFSKDYYMMGGGRTINFGEGPWCEKYMVIGKRAAETNLVKFFERRDYKAIHCGSVFSQDVWFFER